MQSSLLKESTQNSGESGCLARRGLKHNDLTETEKFSITNKWVALERWLLMKGCHNYVRWSHCRV